MFTDLPAAACSFVRDSDEHERCYNHVLSVLANARIPSSAFKSSKYQLVVYFHINDLTPTYPHVTPTAISVTFKVPPLSVGTPSPFGYTISGSFQNGPIQFSFDAPFQITNLTVEGSVQSDNPKYASLPFPSSTLSLPYSPASYFSVPSSPAIYRVVPAIQQTTATITTLYVTIVPIPQTPFL
jgi:hypothetical protein